MKRILIANRGEIASRIIRTCKRLGIDTVAIYTDADKDLPFVMEATTSVRIGEGPVQTSYLNRNLIIKTAIEEKVDAIHPGYGFLSENSSFARQVLDAGFVFIGPEPATIEQMGDKLLSRRIMKEAGVPIVPGSDMELLTIEDAVHAAAEIGYPVMLKASGGGGGIGMVICESEEDLRKHYLPIKKRAKTYFASDSVFVERYIQGGHHIEVQIFGDYNGNLVHLFERECSVQRRHQKVIEETPSPYLGNVAREKIFKTALMAAETVNYVNAGTVEFIVDQDENFYFLEMNTRLQVEHPVTECVTGIDLVEWQLLVATKQPIPLKQEEISSNGYAMEFRIYAEDPTTFLPSPGWIEDFVLPEKQGVRIDCGYKTGIKVTPYYDPMLAKCIVFGETREQVIQTAKDYLDCGRVTGIKTNLSLFEKILQDEQFTRGTYDTTFLSKL